MEEFLIKALGLIMSLSILVILHELGHFIPAKLFGVRVEKFYLFFDPWFSLFKFKKGDTEYGIGWLPLGGYVKLSGMIDESMDTEQLAQEPQPWEFRTKPAWQRLIIMVGGVTVNVLLSILIYAMILFTWGKAYLPANEAVYGVDTSPYMTEIGFNSGDKIVGLNDNPITDDMTYRDIFLELMLDDDITSVSVLRNEEKVIIPIPENFKAQVLTRKERSPFTERIPFIADSILPDSPAQKAGLLKGDEFQTMNGAKAKYYIDFVKAAQANKGNLVDMTVLRNGVPVTVAITISEKGKVGVGNKSPASYFEFETKSYSFLSSIPAGYKEATLTLTNYVRQMKLIFTKEGASQLGGFGTIGNLFPAQWNWQRFWGLTAFLSMVLAFMNILPIPALDGGHVIFLLYEMVTGKEPGEKFMEYAQMSGIFLLVGLMLFANGNDLWSGISKLLGS
ncbi:MAG: regulator of sigma E protease [Salibacteraceae bacterium]|jgi:regulator of sigma E protease